MRPTGRFEPGYAVRHFGGGQGTVCRTTVDEVLVEWEDGSRTWELPSELQVLN